MKTTASCLVISVTGLLLLGLVMLYSASMADHGARYLAYQLVWCGFGLVGCLLAALIDYRWLRHATAPILGLGIVLLVAVLVVGEPVKGARRWLQLGGVNVQASEFAKLAVILFLASYIAGQQRKMQTFFRGFLVPGLAVGVTLGLIFVEPDRGTCLLLAAVSGGMLIVAGLPWRYLAATLMLGGAGLAYSLTNDAMRKGRIYSWLHLEETKLGQGMQAYQAMLALSAGGTFGVGLGDSRLKLGFVPEQYTDFILSIIGEELGVVATLLIVASFLGILVCGMCIARRAPDSFGMLLATGITLHIAIQAFINIGVVTSALPNKGLPLPFISYGGSNLIVMLTSVGLLLSIARRSELAAAAAPAPVDFEDIAAAQTS